MSRQDWHREYFYSPFPRVTTRQTVGKTPISTMLFPLPPKESLAQICPKFPSLWLSLKKKKEKKKTNQKKTGKKNQNCVSSAVGALTTEAAVLSMEAAPVLLHGRGCGG